jgi:hypothetical protein
MFMNLGIYEGFEKHLNLELYGYIIFEMWANCEFYDMSIPVLETANDN